MSDGIESKAEAQYIELMVQRYKNSIEAGQEMDDILKTKEVNIPKKSVDSSGWLTILFLFILIAPIIIAVFILNSNS